MTEIECPKCMGTALRKYGITILSGKKKQRRQCKDCGHVFSDDEILVIDPEQNETEL